MSLLPKDTIEIPLEKISLATSQARQRDTKVEEDDDLVHSIRKDGLISPVIVKKLPDDNYELLIGQRRFRAHEILQKPTIKAYVVEKDIDEFEAKKISLVENAARKDMKHADYVDTVQIFMDRYGSTKTVAEELGLSVDTVRKYLTIGRLPEKIQEEVKAKNISASNAIKALDALGGDESTVDENSLLETAQEIEKLSPQARKKFVEIKKHEPTIGAPEAAEKATKRTELNEFTVEVTDDQLSRIDKFKKNESIDKTEDAAVELIDRGLDSAED
ncbi:MAG: ParB/RepB/Spo0J family partition protein [Candidatus Nitrosopumilus sp. bin_7KS]